MADENGWSEYSRLVLKELETLATSITALNAEIQDLKQEIARMREREDRVDELRAWKEKVDEVEDEGAQRTQQHFSPRGADPIEGGSAHSDAVA